MLCPLILNKLFRKKILLILIFFSFIYSYSISGFITDKTDGEPIPFSTSTISYPNSDNILQGTSADIDGYYILTNIEPGKYQLNISIIGYELYKELITIDKENLRINILLSPAAININEVNISSERTRFEDKVEVSRINITSEEIKMIPAFVESDIFRTLQYFPSVSSANDFNAALIVRGGSPDENLILLDGTQIYNPYHVGGIFSTFNADLISDTEFLAGGFPAQYGNRLSSVLSITSKEGNSKESRLPDSIYTSTDYKGIKRYKNINKMKKYWDYNNIKADISLLSSKISAQGPIYKGSWIFTGRRTYFDQFVSAYNNIQGNDNPFTYYFWDTHLKIQTEPFKYNKFVYSQFNGSDNLSVNISAEDFPSVNFDWGWINSTKSLAWNFFPNSNYTVQTMLSTTEYNFDVGFELDFSSIQEDVDQYCDSLEAPDDTTFIADLTYNLDNKVRDISLNQDIKVFINDKLDMEFGWESKLLEMNYTEEFAGQQTYQNDENPRINSGYIKSLYSPIPIISFDLGLRVSKSSYYDKAILDPRIGLKYMVTSDLALKLMWGEFTQFMFTINQDEELLRLVDFWQAIGENQLPQANDHYVLGLEYWISDGNTFTLETYYKPYSRLYDMSVIYTDITDESSFFTSGKGENWGVEFLYQFNKNKVNGWVGYSYSYINREIDLNRDGIIQENSENYPSNYSKPHSLNFVLNYKLSEKKNTYLGFTGVLSSGAPYTPVIGKSYYASIEQYGSLEQPYAYLANIYGSRNSTRYPIYFRTDISLTRDGKLLKKPVQWKFQIVNLTNNFNVLFYNWNHYSSPSKVSAISMFPLIFTFGVNFEL